MRKQQAKNRGLTLIELLVTIMIMGIVIAIAVPVLRPPVDARSVKEAARMVSTALASARTKSIETGQSWGVEFTPLSSSDSSQVGTLHFCRVTDSYEGFNGEITDQGDFKGLYDPAKITVPWNVLKYGGWLRFGYQGKKYLVPDDKKELENPPGITTLIQLNPAPATGAASSIDFQFYPAPRKSSLMPIQLPSRAVVDMGLSGVGDTFGNNGTPIQKITFTKTGEVDQFHTSLGSSDASERIHFFIERTGRTDTQSTDPEDNHLQDGEAIWVSIDPRTGAIKSAENKPPANLETLNTIENARSWANE